MQQLLLGSSDHCCHRQQLACTTGNYCLQDRTLLASSIVPGSHHYCYLLQDLNADIGSLSSELKQLQATIKAEQDGLADFREVNRDLC